MRKERIVVATNRKAFHDYHILDRMEAGLALTGSEVKSLREGHASLREAYARVEGREVILSGMHIAPYSHTGFLGHEPYRERKLLLNHSEILKLARHTQTKGRSLIPLALYFSKGWAKVELGLGVGKREYDRKAAIVERDRNRELLREMRGRKSVR